MGKINYYQELKDILEMQYVQWSPGHGNDVCLDGWFSTDELRRIANTIDAILAESEVEKDGEQGK